MSKRKSTLTGWIGDMVDDTKDLVDDLIDRAKDLETDVRDSVTDVVEDERRDRPSGSRAEVDELAAALADLTAKVNQLAELQLASASSGPGSSRSAASGTGSAGSSSRRSAA